METRQFETFEVQLREIMDRYIVRSGYWPNLVEESVGTKLGALRLMEQLIQTEIKNERAHLINQSVPSTPPPTLPTPTAEFLDLYRGNWPKRTD